MTAKKPTSIDKSINTAWTVYQTDSTQEDPLVHALMRLAKTIAHKWQLPDIDDTIQDATIKIWSYKHTYNPTKASFATWAGSVVRQVCKEHKQQWLHRKHTETPLDTLPKQDFDKQLEDIGWHVEAQERGVAVEEQLQHLSPANKEVAMLRLRGYSYTEIGKLLDISANAAHERWRRTLVEIQGR